MKLFRILSTLLLATIFIPGAAIAEGEKLADKLANTPIAVNLDVQSCNADAAILCLAWH